MLKLSIITVNFNNKDGLNCTLKSVKDQVYQDFEHIVIDGGSTDGSVELLMNRKGDNFKWISEPDSGIYCAMNKGIQLATGNYLLFLNSGDWLADAFVIQNVFRQGLTADIVYGNLWIVWGDNKRTLGKMPDKISSWHMYLDTLWHPVSFIRKSLFENLGYYNEAFKIVADYDFFVKAIVQHQVSLKHIETAVAVFKTDGISSDPKNVRIIKNERKVIQKRYFNHLLLITFSVAKSIWSLPQNLKRAWKKIWYQ